MTIAGVIADDFLTQLQCAKNFAWLYDGFLRNIATHVEP
jgi:hypothetical protein